MKTYIKKNNINYVNPINPFQKHISNCKYCTFNYIERYVAQWLVLQTRSPKVMGSNCVHCR